MKSFLLILLSTLILSQSSFAQTSTNSSLIGFRRGLATVMLAGLGGAVLGVSTLSFYGNPQEHIGNIWTGLALGAVGGTAYIFSQNQQSSVSALDPLPQSARQKLAQQKPPLFQYSWEF